jgi:hypothetical protein
MNCRRIPLASVAIDIIYYNSTGYLLDRLTIIIILLRLQHYLAYYLLLVLFMFGTGDLACEGSFLVSSVSVYMTCFIQLYSYSLGLGHRTLRREKGSILGVNKEKVKLVFNPRAPGSKDIIL